MKEQDLNKIEKSGAGIETANSAAERLEGLSQELGTEKNNQDRSKEKNEALKEARENAEQSRKQEANIAKNEKEQDQSYRYPLGKKQRDIQFKKTMKLVQKDMPPYERAFSKFIHNKAVDRVSSVVGQSVARPNAMLSGAIAAFVLTSVVYLIARNLGYVLSGFETIGAFIVGWAIGLVFDYLRALLTGKSS